MMRAENLLDVPNRVLLVALGQSSHLAARWEELIAETEHRQKFQEVVNDLLYEYGALSYEVGYRAGHAECWNETARHLSPTMLYYARSRNGQGQEEVALEGNRASDFRAGFRAGCKATFEDVYQTGFDVGYEIACAEEDETPLDALRCLQAQEQGVGDE
jgi:hypothetical protein